jgi:hypothetical protein
MTLSPESNTTLSSEFQELLTKIEDLEQEHELLQALLEEVPSDTKPFLIAQARVLTRQIDALQDELTEQIMDLPESQTTSSPLLATFNGEAILTTTHPQARGPFEVRLAEAIDLEFHDRSSTMPFRRVRITRFPKITYRTTVNSPPLPGTTIVTTVTRSGGGSGIDRGNGIIEIPITLNFSHGSLWSSSQLRLTLSSSSPGSPINPGPQLGSVELRGSGTFVGSRFDPRPGLAGSNGTFILSGTISEVPSVTVPWVRDLDAGNADRLLREVGLVPRFGGDTGAPNAWVYLQSPQGGTVVRSGSTVTLTMRGGPRL